MEKKTKKIVKNAARNLIQAVVDAEEGLEKRIAKDLGDKICKRDRAAVEWVKESMEEQVSSLQETLETGEDKTEYEEAEIKIERPTGGYTYVDMGWALGNLKVEKAEITACISIITETGSYPIRDVVYAHTVDGGITWDAAVSDRRE